MAEPPDDPAPTPPAPARRRALETLITLGGLAYAGALAVPAARFLTAPGDESAAGPRWVRVARLDDLTPGTPARREIKADARDAFTVTPDERLGAVWLLRE